MTQTPLLPGAVGLTHLRVYDTAGPDGLHGGSPHVHFACTECYYVERGRGRVQTLSAEGYHEFALTPGRVVWFSPGVIHRLVNEDKLEILVVMQNSGLPEGGDFVLTMPQSILRDPESYFELASLSARGEVFASGIDAAYRRRDVSVQGFAELRSRVGEEGLGALREFYESALKLVQPKLPNWKPVWRDGPLAAATATGEQLEALQKGDVSHLLEGAARAMAPQDERRLGVCGTLGRYLPEGVSITPQAPLAEPR
ncbi:MAG TPA: cupin domain-containing protein [Armatimonadota bacterium]|nr:cupin domain-containing protein [Armatimonadota bacterium]